MRVSSIVRRRGIALIYVAISMVVLMLLISLAVDFGRVQVAKCELQRVADAAARYATVGLVDNTWLSKAQQSAYDNQVDGSYLTLAPSDVTRGNWNGLIYQSGVTPYNAVQVNARCAAASNTAIPLLFAQVLGPQFCDVNSTSIAQIVLASTTSTTTTGKANPWLSGMPNGTNGGYGDTTPSTSPTQIGLPVTGGAIISFNNSGSGSNTPNSSGLGPDGSSNCVTNITGYTYGMSNSIVPLCSLVAVFLDNSQPDSTAAPAGLNFSTAASRDYTSLNPLLKQVFFVGDGKTSGGVTRRIVAPAGATRMFIGMVDANEWNNNSGSFSINATVANNITTVK